MVLLVEATDIFSSSCLQSLTSMEEIPGDRQGRRGPLSHQNHKQSQWRWQRAQRHLVGPELICHRIPELAVPPLPPCDFHKWEQVHPEHVCGEHCAVCKCDGFSDGSVIAYPWRDTQAYSGLATPPWLGREICFKIQPNLKIHLTHASFNVTWLADRANTNTRCEMVSTQIWCSLFSPAAAMTALLQQTVQLCPVVPLWGVGTWHHINICSAVITHNTMHKSRKEWEWGNTIWKENQHLWP